MNRRTFLHLPAAAAAANCFEARAAAYKGQAKITDIQAMMLQGPRTYTLVKVSSDQGVYGIGEAYGSPGAGVKEQILALKPEILGADPLEIDKLYTLLGRRTDGSAHMLLRAVSGIEMALWDLAGKLLGVPAATLLGGHFRDKVRVYNHGGPADWLDRSSCRDWAQERRADPAGWNCCKFSPARGDPQSDKARDGANRVLTTRELRAIRQGFENCRDALGWDYDIIVHCHWEYDLRTSIQLAEAIEPIQPLYLEDPMPPDYSESWRRLCAASNVPIGKGENLARRHGFKDFIVNSAVDLLNPDLRNTGGLLETKKIADLADLFYIPLCNHNTGSAVCTMATVQWAAAVRDYMVCETVVGKGDWMDDVVVHDGPLVRAGFIAVPEKPGLGIELDPDVVKAHLAAGESYWA